MPEPFYLVWSHEHGAWWGPARRGYVKRIAEAGLYSEEEAIDICAKAIMGRREPFYELPVRLEDVEEMLHRHLTALKEAR